MPSVEGKENVDGQTLPVSCTAGAGTAVPTKQSSCGVGPRSGGRKPSQRIAALGCNSSVDSNLQEGVARASSTSASAAAAVAAAGYPAAGCPTADSAQQSRSLVPAPAKKSGKTPARRSGPAIKAPPNLKKVTDGSASSSVASVVETRKPKRSGGSGAAAAAAAAGLKKSRKSRGGVVLSTPVSLPCASSSGNGRKTTSKKRNLATRDGARVQEGRKAPQRRGVGVGGKKKGKGKGVIKPPSTVTSKPSSAPSQGGRSHFDFDGEGKDISTPPVAFSGEEEAASAVVAKGPQDTAQGGNKKKKRASSAPVSRGPPPPPPPLPQTVPVATTSQVRPAVAWQPASPNQSAGSQSPRGSWHLGALFGESEDEEEETRATGLWRLSDDDGDEPDPLGGGEEPPGRGVGKRRRTTGSVGLGGKASSHGKQRASGGGAHRQKRAATVDAAVGGSGSGRGGGGSGGVGVGGGGGIGDGRRSVPAQEPGITCAAPLVASPDKARARKGGAHPGGQKRQSRGEQQEELEAKELEAMLAQFRRVDSHRLNLSR